MTFCFSENRAVYELKWKKYCTAEQDAGDIITRSMRFACRTPKATTQPQALNTEC